MNYGRRELWAMGYSDSGIAYLTGTKKEDVTRWRKKNGLGGHEGQPRDKKELERFLPRVGETVMVRPTLDGEIETTPMEAVVIHLGLAHLHYTVQFVGIPWLHETYRAI